MFTLFEGMSGPSVNTAYPAYIPLSSFDWNQISEDHVGALVVMKNTDPIEADHMICCIKSFLQKDIHLKSAMLCSKLHLIPCSMEIETSQSPIIQESLFSKFCFHANQLYDDLSSKDLIHGMEMIPTRDDSFILILLCEEMIHVESEWYDYFDSNVDIQVKKQPNTFMLC